MDLSTKIKKREEKKKQNPLPLERAQGPDGELVLGAARSAHLRRVLAALCPLR